MLAEEPVSQNVGIYNAPISTLSMYADVPAIDKSKMPKKRNRLEMLSIEERTSDDKRSLRKASKGRKRAQEKQEDMTRKSANRTSSSKFDAGKYDNIVTDANADMSLLDKRVTVASNSKSNDKYNDVDAYGGGKGSAAFFHRLQADVRSNIADHLASKKNKNKSSSSDSKARYAKM